MNRFTRTSPASPHRRKLSATFAALVFSGIALTGCAAATPEPAGVGDPATPSALLAAYNLDRLDVGEVIERLDTMPVADRPSDLLASVQPDALVLKDERGRESRLPMPEDEVYIAVAPFRDQTHDCHFHSLTTCLGELSNTEIRITLTADDGVVLLEETRRTYDNGFTGFWVPRGIEATLEIENQERSGTALLSTRTDDDPTCITSLQLL